MTSQSELTPEEVAAALNARKWRGVNCWEPYPTSICTIAENVEGDRYVGWSISLEEARAIVLGLKAQDELAELREGVKATQEFLRDVIGQRDTFQARLASLTDERDALQVLCDTIKLDEQRLQERCASLTEENERLRTEAEMVMYFEERDVVEAKVKRLTEENERNKARADRLYEDGMIAHRWFEKRFGEDLNGRDFAVKCPMADAVLDAPAPPVEQPDSIRAHRCPTQGCCREEGHDGEHRCSVCNWPRRLDATEAAVLASEKYHEHECYPKEQPDLDADLKLIVEARKRGRTGDWNLLHVLADALERRLPTTPQPDLDAIARRIVEDLDSEDHRFTGLRYDAAVETVLTELRRLRSERTGAAEGSDVYDLLRRFLNGETDNELFEDGILCLEKAGQLAQPKGDQ